MLLIALLQKKSIIFNYETVCFFYKIENRFNYSNFQVLATVRKIIYTINYIRFSENI